MVAIKMLVSEMDIQIFDHMDSSKYPVNFLLFMENFMSSSKLDGIDIWEDHPQSNKVECSYNSKLECAKILKDFPEKCPVNYNGDKYSHLEIHIWFYQLFPFLLCWVSYI